MSKKEIEDYINSSSLERVGGNTPDFILAEFISEITCDHTESNINKLVGIFGQAVVNREKWYGENCPKA